MFVGGKVRGQAERHPPPCRRKAAGLRDVVAAGQTRVERGGRVGPRRGKGKGRGSGRPNNEEEEEEKEENRLMRHFLTSSQRVNEERPL